MQYRDLGRYSDWVDVARIERDVRSAQSGSALTSSRLRELLGFASDQMPLDPRIEGTWSCEGVVGEEISWSVGYGPRTVAWLFRPESAVGTLPGVLALHDHSGVKFFGKEKIADGPGPVHAHVAQLRRRQYGGRAFVNELARRGFVVLVHDVFMWGSRRFTMQEMQPQRPWRPPLEFGGTGVMTDDQIAQYDRVAADHEHVIAKYCTLLGTSMAGVLAYEDRVALGYLKSRSDICEGRLGCIGMSGGGCRSALLQALATDISVAVVVNMMSTYEMLLDQYVAPHSWMFFPPGLSTAGDWPEVAACRAPSPLIVQYTLNDHLFSSEGMQRAHEWLAARYERAGDGTAYVGQFFNGDHVFEVDMQEAAFDQLSHWLSK